MAYGYSKGFIIEYVDDQPVEKKRKQRSSCKRCVYANLNDGSCSVKPVVFSEDGYGTWKYCKYFRLPGEKKVVLPPQELEKKKANKTQFSKSIKLDKKKLISDVENNNLVTITDSDTQYNTCNCGEPLEFRPAISLIFILRNKKRFVSVPGMYCKKCNRSFVTKKNVIDSAQKKLQTLIR